MKNLRIIFFSLSLLVTGFSFTACGGNAGAADKEGKEYTSAYVCPMHCEDSGSEQAGTCPVCGMDYVALDEHTADEHKH